MLSAFIGWLPCGLRKENRDSGQLAVSDKKVRSGQKEWEIQDIMNNLYQEFILSQIVFLQG